MRLAWLLEPETKPKSATLLEQAIGIEIEAAAAIHRAPTGSRTLAASRPARSNTKRSKLDALEMSIDGLEVC